MPPKKSYRRIAREDYNGKINFGDVQRILQGREPKDLKKRLVLGLPAYGKAPVCLKCGEVHVTKNCTKGRRARAPKDWFDTPVDVIREAFRNRKEI